MYVPRIPDPQVLEDVQRALKTKALREARSQSGASTPISENPSPSPQIADLSITRPREEITSLRLYPALPLPVTPPKPVVPVSTRHSTPSPAAPPRITFPPYVQSPSRSLESLSSEGRLGHSPVPILVSCRDGSTYLDWSGAPPEVGALEKEKSLLGRTFSITKRKSKEKDRLRGLAGRNSLDIGGSQGDLHVGELWFKSPSFDLEPLCNPWLSCESLISISIL
jgi:hypothetical protein